MQNRFAALIVFLLAITTNAYADVWGYVDEAGNTHFASKQIDARYQLYYKTTQTGIVSPAILRRRLSNRALIFNPKADAAAGKKARYLTRRIQLSSAFKKVRPLLQREAAAKGINFSLLKALVAVESGFNPRAVSSAGAVGLMQIMPNTARDLGLRSTRKSTVKQQLINPKTNVRLGTRYLQQMLRQFGGRVDLALAAYNAGPGVVRKRMAVPNYPETQNYVRTILAIYQTLTNSTLPINSGLHRSASRPYMGKRRKQLMLDNARKKAIAKPDTTVAHITIPAASDVEAQKPIQSAAMPTALDLVADKIEQADKTIQPTQ